jgi:DMSO/TMAO reductase YedYZ molybdopterin-dependent catalytic subunit
MPTRRQVIGRARVLGLFAGAGLVALGGRRFWDVTANNWRYNTIEFPVPAFVPADYRLVVDGLVRQPLSLTYEELRALPAATQTSDFHCVEGWGIDDVRWHGVRLDTIIERAQPLESASYMTFHSLGGEYRDSLSVQQATLPDAMLAYTMDDRPLTQDHGAPLRLVMPRMYGYKGPKWVTRVEFRDEQDVGYWEYRGWRTEAWLKAGTT